MNETISPEINLALMKQVERAVRPIPAGKKRKLQMREELLAHLTAIYQEELPRQPNAAAALTSACERFGSPAEISAELIRGVQWNQRLDYHVDQMARFLARWIGEKETSLFRYALGSLSFLLVVAALGVGSLLALFWLLGTTADPVVLPLTLKLTSHFVLSMFCYLLALRTILRTCFQSPRASRWLGGAALLALWLVVFTALSFYALYLITGDVAQCLARTPEFLLSNLCILLPGLLSCAWFGHHAEKKSQPYEAWTRLELDQ